MALRMRSNGTSFKNVGGEKLSENPIASRLAAKSYATKSQVTQRAALGNISNVQRGSTAQVDVQKAKKKDAPTKRVVAKAKSTSLASKASQPKQEVKPASPEKMDFEEVIDLIPKCLGNIEDIDKDDAESPQLCSEYVKEIYEYMHLLEVKYKVNHNYMDDQEITARMRTILVDWLIQVHLRFHLLQETLFLSVQLIDRYLSVGKVSRNKLQLVGVTAMFIASKYEEMYPPEINDFVYITDNAYTQAQIRSTERMMLEALDFNMGMPLCLHFLRRNSKAAGVDPKKHTMAKYLMELALPDFEFVQYDPSEIAAAALYMSIQLTDSGETEWGAKMTHYSMYSEEHLAPIVQSMAKLVLKSETSKYQAVRNKYASSKFLKISSASELNATNVQRLLKC